MRSVCHLLTVMVGIALALPASAAAAPKKERCLVNRDTPAGPALNTFVFQEVKPLKPGQAIPVQGVFFTQARRPAPFHGGAVMASDGTVRLGLFVHSSADSTNDFTLSGVTDADFAGVLNFDSDGDFRPNGTLPVESVDCNTITIP